MRKQEEEMNIRAVCFKADGEQTVTIKQVNISSAKVFQYSYDGVTWESWDLTPLPFGGNTKVYIRGYNNVLSYSSDIYEYFSFGTDAFVYVSGIVESLLDGDNEVLSLNAQGILRQLFYQQTALRSAEDLRFEAQTVNGTVAYARMFEGCTNLIHSPRKISAKTIGNYSCANMFRGCTSLLTAPELPATTVGNYCYQYMFYGCTSLISAPKLNAISVGERSCEYMFSGCTNLINVPALPAAKLGTNCYQFMFYGCTSLLSAPELPSTTLAIGCYAAMFKDCTNLVDAPELPVTSLASYCYSQMFRNCPKLVNAPELPAESLAVNCYNYMFYGCTSLKTIRCHAKVTASNATNVWLDGVATTGTFYGHSEYGWSSGNSGIPYGWTFVELTD